MKNSIVVVAALVAVLCLGTTQAAYWSFFTNQGGAGDGMWNTAANWDTGAVPSLTNTDYAAGMAAVNGDLHIDGYAEVKNFLTGVWGGSNNANLTNGSYFYVSESSTIGYAGGPCTFANNGGAWSLGGSFFVGSGDQAAGNGILNQNAGSITVGWRMLVGGEAWLAGSTGTINLNGGTITTNGPTEINAGGLIDFAGGDLYFAGYGPDDAAALVESWKTNGYVTAFDGTGVVQYAFDNDLYKMHVWGVPEPATLMLLALGGVAMRVRKNR